MTRSQTVDLALANRLLVGAREVRALRDRLVADRFLYSKEDKAMLDGLLWDAEEAAGRLMLRVGDLGLASAEQGEAAKRPSERVAGAAG